MALSYWWECERCKRTFNFKTACGSKGITHYIRDVLLPCDWDQLLLVRDCPNCRERALRIAYKFPRADEEKLRVIHIVGLGKPKHDYIPMMWETLFAPYDDETCFDFKYIRGKNINGLTKPAVFTRKQLSRVFDLYCKKTGLHSFP